MKGRSSVKRDEGNFIIKRFVSPANKVNVYLVISGTEAAVVDAADTYQDIANVLDELQLDLKYVFITHGHKSHVQAAPMLKESFGGTICIHALDSNLLKESGDALEPDMNLKDRESLPLGGIMVTVIHTPGHTPGSLCFYLKKVGALFSGDTILKGEFGKIWGPHSMGLMLRSLKRLNSIMPPKTVVYPGHGSQTSMSKEAWLDCLDNLS